MTQASPAQTLHGLRSHIWTLLLASGLVTWVGLAVEGVSIEWTPLTGLALWTAASGALVLLQDRLNWPWSARLIDWFETFALLSTIALVGCLSSYAVAAAGNSYADEWLAGLDRAIGFDWRIAYRFVEHSPWVQTIGCGVYKSIFLSPIMILAGLCATGRGAMARHFVFVYGLALWITMAMFAIVPARGPIEYFHLGHESYKPITNVDQAVALAALRAGSVTIVHVGKLHGLVSFPSFHAASAILFVWAARPLRRLFWPVVAINAAMLCATPVEGNHYLVDLIGGGVVAGVSIWVGNAWARLAASRRATGPAFELGTFARSLPPARAAVGVPADEATPEIAVQDSLAA